MNKLSKIAGGLVALCLISLPPVLIAGEEEEATAPPVSMDRKSDGRSGVSVRCGDYIFYKITSPGKGSACIEDQDNNESVVCSDEQGPTAEANCSDGCKMTAREGTCERIDLTPPPPPPPPAST